MKKHEGAKYEGKAEIARYYMHVIQFSSWIKSFCNILVALDSFGFGNCEMYRNQEMKV